MRLTYCGPTAHPILWYVFSNFAETCIFLTQVTQESYWTNPLPVERSSHTVS